jgi:hypothetical protein
VIEAPHISELTVRVAFHGSNPGGGTMLCSSSSGLQKSAFADVIALMDRTCDTGALCARQHVAAATTAKQETTVWIIETRTFMCVLPMKCEGDNKTSTHEKKMRFDTAKSKTTRD